MRVTIRSEVSGTYVSRIEVPKLDLLGLIVCSKGIKRLYFEDDEAEVTTKTYEGAVELFDVLMDEELRDRRIFDLSQGTRWIPVIRRSSDDEDDDEDEED